MKASSLVFLCLALLPSIIGAAPFHDLNDAIKERRYSSVLLALEQEKLPNVTKRRLLIRLVKNWNELSKPEQKKFNMILVELLPADQMVVEKIKERTIASDKKKADRSDIVEEEEKEEVMLPVIVAPTPAAPRPIVTLTPAKKTVQKKSLPPQKQIPQKKVVKKQPAPSKKQMPEKKPLPPKKKVVVKKVKPVQKKVEPKAAIAPSLPTPQPIPVPEKIVLPEPTPVKDEL